MELAFQCCCGNAFLDWVFSLFVTPLIQYNTF